MGRVESGRVSRVGPVSRVGWCLGSGGVSGRALLSGRVTLSGRVAARSRRYRDLDRVISFRLKACPDVGRAVNSARAVSPCSRLGGGRALSRSDWRHSVLDGWVFGGSGLFPRLCTRREPVVSETTEKFATHRAGRLVCRCVGNFPVVSLTTPRPGCNNTRDCQQRACLNGRGDHPSGDTSRSSIRACF